MNQPSILGTIMSNPTQHIVLIDLNEISAFLMHFLMHNKKVNVYFGKTLLSSTGKNSAYIS